MAPQTPVPASGPQPELRGVDPQPQFAVVMRGYDGQEVDAWIKRALAYVRHLEQEGLTKAEAILRAAAFSPQGQKSIADLLQLAADEVTQNRVAAAQESAQVVADAEALAAQVKAAAQQEALQLVAGAQDQANTVLQGAHAQGKQMLDDAAQKAAAVNQGAEARMAEVTRIHGETLRRLGEMNRVTGELLHSESDRGSLEDEVQRIIHPER